jgi:hypothetical protein
MLPCWRAVRQRHEEREIPNYHSQGEGRFIAASPSFLSRECGGF